VKNNKKTRQKVTKTTVANKKSSHFVAFFVKGTKLVCYKTTT